MGLPVHLSAETHDRRSGSSTWSGHITSLWMGDSGLPLSFSLSWRSWSSSFLPLFSSWKILMDHPFLDGEIINFLLTPIVHIQHQFIFLHVITLWQLNLSVTGMISVRMSITPSSTTRSQLTHSNRLMRGRLEYFQDNPNQKFLPWCSSCILTLGRGFLGICYFNRSSKGTFLPNSCR